MPTKTSTPQPASSPIDKFPPYEESLDAALGSNRPTPTPSVKYAPGELWEPRKSAFYARDHANEPSRTPKHQPRKSISEAITTIRTRNGSVSANAQELAEALRAPVSYRLTVRLEDAYNMKGEGLMSLHRRFAWFGTLPLPSPTPRQNPS